MVDTNTPITVHMALARVAGDVGAVGKGGKMEAGPARYKYRTLDDLMDTVHGPLAKHGVTFAPSNIQMLDTLEKTTKSGGIQYHLRAIVTYAIYGPAGDCIYATVIAEGTDSGDKAGNKLMSTAFKYTLGQVLHIPFTMDDQDATLSEPVMSVAQVKQAFNATEVTSTESKQLHQRLAEAASAMGMDAESVSAKWRAANGRISMDEFLELPADRIRGFVRQVTTYANEQKNAEKKEAEAKAQEQQTTVIPEPVKITARAPRKRAAAAADK